MARSRFLSLVLVAIPLGVGLWHVWLVSRLYFVGSFDDDASYLLTAQAILHGGGLTGHLVSGASIVGAYPPGYPALLVPLLAIWPHDFTPERVLSAVCFAAVFPLLWVYLGRRGAGDVIRTLTLSLLALSPVAATFGSMVMAETAFLVVLMVLLLLVDGWEASDRLLGPRGITIVVASASLVWLKEAGIGIVVGLGLWYLFRREILRAVAVVGGTLVLLVPVVVGRLIGGVPLEGARYSQELGGYYSGGLVARLFDVTPPALLQYFSTALPASVVPSGEPLPQTGAWGAILSVFAWHVGIVIVIGLIVAIRRHRDATVIAVTLYTAETMLWPFVNERRVILVLPIILFWYVLGLAFLARWIWERILHLLPDWPRSSMALRTIAFSAVGGVAIAYPLIIQFPRDYLFGLNTPSSRPQGSRYMSVLAAVGTRSTVVETDYESTTALFTGHPTANTAFIGATATVCDVATTVRDIGSDGAGFLLLGTLNKPRVIDNACLQAQATSMPFAVRLLRTNEDQASVFELIGPHTAHPDFVDRIPAATIVSPSPTTTVRDDPLARGDYPGTSTVLRPVDGQATVTWRWGSDDPLSQVSIGEVKSYRGGTLSGATLEILDADDRWIAVADAPGVVGDGGSPYLLGELPPETRATAMRLVVRADRPVVVTDIHALGTATGGGR